MKKNDFNQNRPPAEIAGRSSARPPWPRWRRLAALGTLSAVMLLAEKPHPWPATASSPVTVPPRAARRP